MAKPSNYGQYFYTILVADNGAKAHEVRINACAVEIGAGGTLTLLGCYRTDKEQDEGLPHKEHRVNASFGAGTWRWIHASSCLDGSAVAADYWKGQAEGRV